MKRLALFRSSSRIVAIASIVAVALALSAARSAHAKDAPAAQAPAADAIPALAASLASKVTGTSLHAPDGSSVDAGSILDASRAETCLKTIGAAEGWPASWLIVSDSTRPYDMVVRVVLGADGTIAAPETIFLTGRREWDDAAFDAAFKAATGKKPPRESKRSVVVQSFTKKSVTDYVYDLPATGAGAKGLLAELPAGSLIREAATIDLRDGKHHTLAVVLNRPRFVPADCATEAGRKTGHRDAGGILLVLAGEKELEDKLDLTDDVTRAIGGAYLPRFTCLPGDTEPGAIDALVDKKMEGREPVKLLDLSGHAAETALDGLPIVVGVKRDGDHFKLFSHPR